MPKRLVAALLCVAMCLAGAAAATMDARVNAVPKGLMEKVFVEPEETLPSVVASLTSGMSAPAAKVKVLHDWICHNIVYDTVVFTDRWQEARDQSYATVLRKRKAVCAGYTNLMSRMCALAGVEAVGISGWSKGFAYTGTVDGPTNHAWNAVKLGNKWQLVDVTWDAGHCDGDYFVKCYSTEWLYRTPREFLYSHLPEDDKYQYYTPIVTKEQFVQEPYIPGVFFEKGFSLVKDKSPLYTNLMPESRTFEISCSRQNLMIRTQLYPHGEGASDGRYLENSVWSERKGQRILFDADVPGKGLYRLTVFCRDPSVPDRPDFYSFREMEGTLLPDAEKLLAAKKITERELNLLKSSFFKHEEYGRYYFLENQFDTERNRAVDKFFRLMSYPPDHYDTVLYFDLKADEGYDGFGLDVARFPRPFEYFLQSSRGMTSILSPEGGVVKKGSELHFRIESKEFRAFSLYGGDGEPVLFDKNPKTGIFELDFTVPEGMDILEVMGSTDGRVLQGVWYYLVE
ncbi:MAG: hypothetical protein IJL80_11570 [Treponema sp.]|nr:hypothetical protein [Treponema sp.]